MTGRVRAAFRRPWVAALGGAAAMAIVTSVAGLVRGVPASSFASRQAESARKAERRHLMPAIIGLTFGGIDTRRAILDQRFFGPKIDAARRLYPVIQTQGRIAGVHVERFEPKGGVPAENAGRILINLHGGGFAMGARTEGRLESIPVAAVARMPVISVDYRQGPEHRFPAASEDVARVYAELLKTHRPDQIGIYGCSAGGMLGAQAIAWFQAHGLPRPAALGIFCAGAGSVFDGDSLIAAKALGAPALGNGPAVYFDGARVDDPLVSPLASNTVLKGFPPSLVISATRDPALSAALVTHRRLLANGVPAELHVFEGVGHFFFSDTALPESRDAFRTMADFFNRRLAPGARRAPAGAPMPRAEPPPRRAR